MVNWKKYRFFLLNLLLILSCITKNIVESSQIEHLIFKIPSSNFTLMKLCASLLVSIFNILYVFDFLTPYLDVETNIKIRKKEKYYYFIFEKLIFSIITIYTTNSLFIYFVQADSSGVFSHLEYYLLLCLFGIMFLYNKKNSHITFFVSLIAMIAYRLI
ncbi:putative transmembrane protein [Erysipelothrix rhusiopathiae str. Fujisawa]|nr:hypothetical protein A2I91_02085 [Erysipelothrix rhusiopathiae]AOO67068.1 hypothetical protein BC346_01630 [Erysipelothrix rhusiopathiae]QDE03190.1 membrane protein [Erysipelothrix rhusiopathiae]QDS39689.1 hypothetical protein FPT19_07860 [Erysipelothrix rhusiopathiae]BAK32424.1 putative transmembrane protein [Erysipelothrix rhusiopathiae str. Fujisawa]